MPSKSTGKSIKTTAPRPRAALPRRQPRASLIRQFSDPKFLNLALVGIVLLAALFRFQGLKWDEGRHLHPDERFLSTVTNDIKWPAAPGTYFDPATSTLSPFSLPNVGLFVYGTLPVYVVKFVAIALDMNNYDAITLVGRALSGVFDIATILMLFLIARRLYAKGTAVLAALFLALSVFDIQLSHFYAVDTYANLFIVATFYFLLRAVQSGRWMDYALTGIMLGLGLASKISALTLAAPILLGIGLDYYRRSRLEDTGRSLEQTVVRLVTVALAAGLVFRVAQPVAFSGPGFGDLSFYGRWIRDMTEQQKTVSGLADQPWIQQWTSRSFFFPLYNIVVWGLGIPLGLASLAGVGLAVYELIRKGKTEHLLPLTYVIVTFIYHAATFVKFMRYFLPLYPFLALFAAYLLTWLWNFKPSPRRRAATARGAASRLTTMLARASAVLTSRPAALGIGLVVVLGTLLYAIAFSSIYTRDHPRIAASRWIYANIPAGSTLANEHWDDWLPVGGVDGFHSYGDTGTFKSVEMGNYEDDNPAKLDRMVESLTAADYVILSSNRLYESIPRLPIRYPMTIRYYDLLFGGQLGYERVSTFTSYPTLLGLEFPDQAAEESFSVYDHPKVQVFRKTAAFDPAVVRQALSLGIDWDSVVHLTPLQATKAPDGLTLSSADRQLYAAASTTSSANIGPGSLGSRIPVIAWFVALMVVGVLALPLTLLAFRGFVDRGYILSKSIGLLLATWGAWMLASLRVAPFTWWLILIMLALVGIASAILAGRHWTQLRRFLIVRWRLLVLEEILFWLLFAAFLIVRIQNPDLWHPGTGGEKPMDFAYLNAIVRTPYFPSYDPWFAGGYINYYYFGFVLVAALVHLTGIVPSIAYNLAVPTFFALTGAAAFTVALNLARALSVLSVGRPPRLFRVRTPILLAGVCGALFVAVIGNLAQVKLLWDAVLALSALPADASRGALGTLARFIDGLNLWISGRDLPIKTDWWYWNATRVIPAGEGEAGPINEMPYFTFLYADLHAHAMALPYTLLALALSLRIAIYGRVRALRKRAAGVLARVGDLPVLALTSLVIGVLWPLNTWDFPTYLGLIGVALALGELARNGRLDLHALGRIAARWVLITVGALLLFQPFHSHYASAYFGAQLWKGSRSPFWAYLLIHGFFLFVLISYMLIELFAGHGHNALVRSTRLTLRYLRRPARLRRLVAARTKPTPGYLLAVTLSRILLAIVIVLLILSPVAGLVVGLGLLATLLLWSKPSPGRQFALVLIGTGLFLTGGVEYVVLKGDISRMNTVFKFFLQVWVLWAISSAAALPRIAQWLNRSRHVGIATPARKRSRSRRAVRVAPTPAAQPGFTASAQRWFTIFGLLLAACFLYPLTATPVRVNDRFPESTSRTLDGTFYMRTSTYFDEGRPVVLEWDRQAAEWLRANAQGLPTILEATTPLYRWGSRISIYTGLPTVIGWDWHQKQQRSVIPGPLIDRRIENVRRLYNTADIAEATALIKQLGVDYIVVGQLERYYYDPLGLAKFESPGGPWELAYQNEQVQIYMTR